MFKILTGSQELIENAPNNLGKYDHITIEYCRFNEKNDGVKILIRLDPKEEE